jgi:RsiW-degrading membrane proteinase PrsW (M82 family)
MSESTAYPSFEDARIPEGASARWTAWRVVMLVASILVVIWLGWYAGHIRPKG